MEEIVNNQSSTEPDQHATPSQANSLRLHELHSRIFHNQRMLRVWVPPGYDLPENSAKRYPVFYLNDGQNLFESATSFTGVEWEVDETANRMIAERTDSAYYFRRHRQCASGTFQGVSSVPLADPARVAADGCAISGVSDNGSDAVHQPKLSSGERA